MERIKRKMSKRKETIGKRIKRKSATIAVDFFAVVIVSTALLAEKAKDKIRNLVDELKVDKIPAL